MARRHGGGGGGPGGRLRHRHGRRCAEPAVPRRQLRCRDHLRGDGAHTGRQGRAGRDGPGAAPRRPDRGHGAPLRPREGLLGAQRRLSRGRGRPYPHLPRRRAAGQDAGGRSGAVRHPPRARAAQPLLVAEMRLRGGQRQGAAGAGVPQAAGLGHHEEAAGHPARRAGTEPRHRQELRRLRHQAASARAGRCRAGRGRGVRRRGERVRRRGRRAGCRDPAKARKSAQTAKRPASKAPAKSGAKPASKASAKRASKPSAGAAK